MKRLAALAALVLAGCASSPWERSARTPAGRLRVPRVFAPVVPGSIYPDRSRPVPARGLPGVVVAARGARARRIADDLGRRGVLVVIAGGAGPGPALRALRAAPEAGGPTGLFLDARDAPARDLALEGVGAIVVAGDPGNLPAWPAGASVLVLRAGTPSGPAPAGVAERWYASPGGRLPALALKDGADWLAAALRRAEP